MRRTLILHINKYIAFTPSNDDEYYALDDIDEDEK